MSTVQPVEKQRAMTNDHISIALRNVDTHKVVLLVLVLEFPIEIKKY